MAHVGDDFKILFVLAELQHSAQLRVEDVRHRCHNLVRERAQIVFAQRKLTEAGNRLLLARVLGDPPLELLRCG